MHPRHTLIATATIAAATMSLTLSTSAVAEVPAPHRAKAPALSQADTEEFTPVEERYWGDQNLRAILGEPVDTEHTENNTSWQQFQRGWLTSTEEHGVHETHGDIAKKYGEIAPFPFEIGVATTDELSTPDGVGRFNHFAGTKTIADPSIYWTPSTGAQVIENAPKVFWSENGYETGYLSYPTTSTTDTPHRPGVYNHFLGADNAGASVYWSPESNAHSVQGTIRDRWAQLGWEDSYLGFPTSDEYDVEGGKRTDFQGGHIVWNASTGVATDYHD